jgi:hypothetical protein
MIHLETIKAITLPEFTASGVPAAPPPRERAGRSSAEINSGALLVFGAALTSQMSSDISNSVLFSQLAADAQFSRFVKPTEWVKRYLEVMSQIGWIQTSFDARTPVSVPAPAEWVPIVTQILRSGQALAQAGITGAQALAQASAPMKIWNGNAFSGDHGLMMLVPAQLASGSIRADFGLTVFEFDHEIDQFLSWSLAYQITQLSSTQELNEEVYARVRETIIEKLGNRPRYLVADVPLKLEELAPCQPQRSCQSIP